MPLIRKQVVCILVLFLLHANAAIAIESISHAHHSHPETDSHTLASAFDHAPDSLVNKSSNDHCETHIADDNTSPLLHLQQADSDDECDCEENCCTTSGAFLRAVNLAITNTSNSNSSLHAFYQSKVLDLLQPPPEF